MSCFSYHVFKVCPFCKSRDTIEGGQCSRVTCAACNKTFDYMKIQYAINHSDLRKKVERVLEIYSNID